MKKDIIVLQPFTFGELEMAKINRWIVSHSMEMYEPIEPEGVLLFDEKEVVAIMSDEKVPVTILKLQDKIEQHE